MKIYFSHGKESGPVGTKIKRLSEVCEALDLTWESIDYTDLPDDPEARVARLEGRILQDSPLQPRVLVGSSMGGYVSAVVAQKFEVAGLFLLAPALFMPTYTHHDFSRHVPHTAIVHGWEDDLIPLENVLKYAQLQKADLHVLRDGHRLTRVTPQIAGLFEQFLRHLMPS